MGKLRMERQRSRNSGNSGGFGVRFNRDRRLDTIGVDPVKIINPRQLERCMESGAVMGLSEALKEEVTFDQSKVTSTNWSSYKILTMVETPDLKIVQISRRQSSGGGSEAANATGPPAVAAAFFDATGVHARELPLTPARVVVLLRLARTPSTELDRSNPGASHSSASGRICPACHCFFCRGIFANIAERLRSCISGRHTNHLRVSRGPTCVASRMHHFVCAIAVR